MKSAQSISLCLGVIVGFAVACVLGHQASHRNIYRHFHRLHPYIEQETAYFPTASQLIAIARAECPPHAEKTLVVIGGNSVFNGSGQKREQLWSRVLQDELGDRFCVVNFSAPGAGIVDNGGVIFEALAREYPRAVFVANSEPGYYAPANRSPYSYLFWDAYYKGLLPPEVDPVARKDEGEQDTARHEFKLGRWLNSRLYFNDLWTEVAYRYASTIWTSWLKSRSFLPRRSLPDWYDKRPPVKATESAFRDLLPGHLESLRHRRPLDAARFQLEPSGALEQTRESLEHEDTQVAALLPAFLHKRALIVITPYNPWFLAHLTDEERQRVAVSFRNEAELLKKEGYHALSLHDRGFEPGDFGDTVHMSPDGARRLAHLVAESIRAMTNESPAQP